MDTSALTPAQHRVVVDLMALGEPRPSFDPELAPALRAELESGLAEVAPALAARPLPVNKASLTQVHACEAHHVAEHERRFEWNVRTARGSVVHKALELSITVGGEPVALDLVDHAIECLEADDSGWDPGTFLSNASSLQRADLRAAANDVVTKFLECWPPLKPHWLPRTEAGIRAELHGGAITLRAKVDLALGRAVGNQARVLIVDLKTGRAYATHADDLRFYALVQTLRVGVPPFRVASYYLDAASFHYEDVPVAGLYGTVRRVVDGATKLAELHLGQRRPQVVPGPTCDWCCARHDCAGRPQWEHERASADDRGA